MFYTQTLQTEMRELKDRHRDRLTDRQRPTDTHNFTNRQTDIDGDGGGWERGADRRDKE